MLKSVVFAPSFDSSHYEKVGLIFEFLCMEAGGEKKRVKREQDAERLKKTNPKHWNE